MKRVFLDACAVIYLVEGQSNRAHVVKQHMRGREVYVSELSRLECFVQPLRSKDKITLDAFEVFFSSPAIHVVPVSRSIIDAAASIRARFPGVRTPDAINVASAVESGVD